MPMADALSESAWMTKFPLRVPILAGWMSAAAFIVGLGCWSVLAPMTSATIATGELVVYGMPCLLFRIEL